MIQLLLEYILGHLSEHHQKFPGFLAKHHGKYCQFVIGRFKTTLYFHQSGFLFCDQTTNNQIILSLDDFILILLSKKASVVFHGDISLCQDLSRLLSTQHLDMDSLLFSILPDGLALATIESLDLLKTLLKHTQSQSIFWLKDYLTHETGICATREEANLLYEKTVQLKWLIERQ